MLMFRRSDVTEGRVVNTPWCLKKGSFSGDTVVVGRKGRKESGGKKTERGQEKIIGRERTEGGRRRDERRRQERRMEKREGVRDWS
ncbi:hypothetical protein TNCV_706831 [Trichonephila clavipes]|nr:hypothetical protein TNCV_706831 [Trichonephila clavipes]